MMMDDDGMHSDELGTHLFPVSRASLFFKIIEHSLNVYTSLTTTSAYLEYSASQVSFS
jgi:hypothetical protein